MRKRRTYLTSDPTLYPTMSPMVPLLLLAISTLLLTGSARSQTAESPATENLSTCDLGEPNPSAPKELDQFAFLIGNYDIENVRRNPDGSWGEPRRAYWEGRWILGDTAVADYWYDQPPVEGANPGRGVNIRMYRPESKQWTNMWQHSGGAQVMTLISEVRDDGFMHMWATDPDTSAHRRLRFESKDSDHWTRFEEWSRDEGKTWFEVAQIRASRSACPWKPSS